jgi:hypothetical protein
MLKVACIARDACVVHYEGVGLEIKPGQLYDRDDPAVRAAPWAFDLVEDATADPGAKRSVRR